MPKAPAGCKDLRMKWWKATLADLKSLGLPKPDHDYGFSSKMLYAHLSPEERKKMDDFMYGQTCMVDEKLGTILYTHDVIRGIKLIRNGTPTYWD